jgi:hypothetical protein
MALHLPIVHLEHDRQVHGTIFTQQVREVFPAALDDARDRVALVVAAKERERLARGGCPARC